MVKLFKSSFLVCFFGFLSATSLAQSKSKVEILNAGNFEYIKADIGPIIKLIGNVKLKQVSTFMDCDSALIYENENKVEAYSNVKINHKDSVTIFGNYLLYDGLSKKGYITKDVKMIDKNMTLTTDQLDYDFTNQFGYYGNGGTIISKNNKLTSDVGYYYARQKEFFFKKNVVLTNPEYVMTSDTLMYNTFSKIAYFFGPTKIIAKADQIYCENGWYDTENDISQFSKNAVLFSDRKMLKADSLYYDRKIQLGKAFRNIHVYDSAQKIHLFGYYGRSNGLTKITFVNKESYAIKIMDQGDSLFLFSDTLMILQRNKKQKQMLIAYNQVKIFKSDLQAVCDSLVYNNDDSSMFMYQAPVMWSGHNQITSDTIVFFINNDKLDSFNLLSNALVISKEKGAHYNQIKGKEMTGILDSSAIKVIKVFGNGQSIYYSKEDSIRYIGVNKIDCSEMIFYFKKGELEKAVFITDADATLYPLDELKPEELRLKGFKWLEKRRPQKLYYQKKY